VSEKERILNKILNDKSRPVEFKDSYGGSENQLRLLFKNVDDEYFKDVNLILNSTDPKLLEKNKINILWMQHYVNQKETENLKNKEYINKLNYIVFNSNWNFENFKIQYKIPENKSIVLRNAINKIDFKNKTKDKISLIYHTTPWRGLELLLKVFKKINKENVELNVCSSTIIYGKKFHDSYEKKFQKLFDDCKNTKNVNFHGYKSNSSILEMLKEVHIFSYPSIWAETSCIAAIEAMAAGCEVVTTNLGALKETCSPFAKFVNFEKNLHNLELNYLSSLIDSINNFWSEDNQQKLKTQREKINQIYSWETRKVEWTDFLKKIKS
tara:strand:- start:157 stop:1131 length:975 start_codon:yes stop_codon:yes gene_type:complete